MSPPKMSASASVRSMVSPPRRPPQPAMGLAIDRAAHDLHAPGLGNRQHRRQPVAGWFAAERGGIDRRRFRTRTARHLAVVRPLEAIRLRCRAPSAGRTPPRRARRCRATSVAARPCSRSNDARVAPGATRADTTVVSAASTMSRPAAWTAATEFHASTGGQPGTATDQNRNKQLAKACHRGRSGPPNGRPVLAPRAVV